ncbi:MAG: FKBP-type peptidyl-prolyl cis-trans isomerase [Solirubrobacteraceae bacterium]
MLNIKLNRTPSVAALLAASFGLAACGSSKAPGVVLAPSGGPTSVTAAATTTPTAPTASTPTTSVTTPKPPSPLSRRPAVVVPKAPAPKRLVIKDLIRGKGAVAKTGSNITVNYVGVLYKGGKEFDASWKTGKPFGPFALGQGAVIPGWDKGLVGMRVGGRRELIIPPGLAYGKSGQGSSIPPNATLVFVVDLLAVA